MVCIVYIEKGGMQLPTNTEKLINIGLSKKLLVSEIKKRRRAIRKHRDQKLDDRCWLDDYWLYEFLEDALPSPTRLPNFTEMMERCREFYTLRRKAEPDPIPSDAILDCNHWNEDLKFLDENGLCTELHKIQCALSNHRDVSAGPRSVQSDRELYGVLPEKIPADFRLPEEADFLGERKSPHAGCPSFWRSHMNCTKPCDIHSWGPCS